MKRAFSLIELLIVIAIISLFGFLAFSTLKTSAQKQVIYKISNLKKLFKSTEHKELICIDKCKKCYARDEGSEKLSEIKSDISPLKAYIVDKDDNPRKIDFGKYDDHHICLRFIHYSNGSSSQLIVESNGKFFYLPSFFGKTESFDSLDEATKEWTKDSRLLTDQGNYYR